MIEQIVEFCSQLQLPSLVQREVLDDSRIQKEETRLPKGVARQNIGEGSIHRDFAGEWRCVSDAQAAYRIIDPIDGKEQVIVRRQRVGQQGGSGQSAGQLRPSSFDGEIRGAEICQTEWLTCLIAGKATNFPSFRCLTP